MSINRKFVELTADVDVVTNNFSKSKCSLPVSIVYRVREHNKTRYAMQIRKIRTMKDKNDEERDVDIRTAATRTTCVLKRNR